MARPTMAETEPSSEGSAALKIQVERWYRTLLTAYPEATAVRPKMDKGRRATLLQGACVHARQVHVNNGGIAAKADPPSFRLIHSA
jgi:hypothetical protein